MLELLQSLQQENRFACLFISHDLFVVQSVCQRVAVLNRGRIVEQGDARRVLRDPHDEYTRRLVLSAPVPNPEQQAARRDQRAATL